jgi:GTP-binding protein EngB required for normal cell division
VAQRGDNVSRASRREAALSEVSVAERVDALERALDGSTQHVGSERADAARSVVTKVRSRMGHGTEHTVIALAGSTGVGKSSLFNALVGADVSNVGVRRPTTGVAHAAVWGEASTSGTNALLDWLQIGHRHHAPDDPARVGLILIDLPDFDSIEATNRAEVDRLIALVDAMIWVTDPQKYADEALHDGYVRPLAAHQHVLRFAINKIDTVAPAERDALVADFAARLRDDGIDAPEIRVISVTSRDGLDSVAALVADTVDRRQVVVDRLVADLRTAGSDLVTEGSTDGVTKPARRALIERLGRAAGADEAGAIVASQHRKDARMVMGWPPVRILERLRRRHPISDLPRASASSVARSEIDLALRDIAESAAGDLDAPWPNALRSTAAHRSEDLTSRLTSTTNDTARTATARPRWWTPVAALQKLVTLVAIIGALWLVTVAVLGGFFQLDTEPLLIDTPRFDWIPVPSLMVLAGLALGALIALLVRLPVSIAAQRRGRSVRSKLLDRIGELVDGTVIADLDHVLDERQAVLADLAIATA